MSESFSRVCLAEFFRLGLTHRLKLECYQRPHELEPVRYLLPQDVRKDDHEGVAYTTNYHVRTANKRRVLANPSALLVFSRRANHPRENKSGIFSPFSFPIKLFYLRP